MAQESVVLMTPPGNLVAAAAAAVSVLPCQATVLAAFFLTQRAPVHPPETSGKAKKGGACSRAGWVPVLACCNKAQPATTFQGEGGGSEPGVAETLIVLEAKQTPH